MQNQNEIERLKKKIKFIEQKQDEFQNYISKLKSEINSLSKTANSKVETKALKIEATNQETSNIQKNIKAKAKPVQRPTKENPVEKFIAELDIKSNLENFIGTNLINKIGILILIIGVLIGSKYAIDNELINPLTRVIIGYVISIALLVFSIKLRVRYEKFSAVLLSGALCMLYFLSFIAYDFYAFIPQTVAFGLMFLFTLFAVFASLQYNNQIIALIGLVGSYAIPFLLSNNSGNYLFLFTYIAIINIGLLILSLQKNWKSIFYIAFFFTWLIFSFWLVFSTHNYPLGAGLFFSGLYYLIFYTCFIAYKLIKKEVFLKMDIVFILLNSFIFFACGYTLLKNNSGAEIYLGLFTLVNALVHFIVSKLFFTQEKADKKLFYLAASLVFVFITIAIPVQLDGNWVTLLWVAEACILFAIGRLKNVAVFEKIAVPIFLLSFFSLIQDWTIIYESRSAFFNITFITAILSSIAFGVSNYIHFTKPLKSESIVVNFFLNWVLPSLFLIISYYTFYSEIELYFNTAYYLTGIQINKNDYEQYIYNENYYFFGDLFLLWYSIVFVCSFVWFSLKYIKKSIVSYIGIGFSIMLLLVSLSIGLMYFSDLRDIYLHNEYSEFFPYKSILNLGARYIHYLFILALMVCIKFLLASKIIPQHISKHYNILVHLVIVWLLSSELLHWLDFFGNENNYKLALTILWAAYALFMVSLGLLKDQKNTRIAGIALFTITLVKLFLYDISNLSMLSKTIVLIVLGVLLLIISFLYNKFTKEKKNE